MAPVKNPNNNTGTVPKSTPSASSSSSSMLEISQSGSSSISSDPNGQSASIRINGGAAGGGSGGAGGGGGGVEECADGGNGLGVRPSSGVGTMAIAPSTAKATTVPQSGGIGTVGGAMANAYVLRKNTEIVAPIRRELKDLNDYFLSVTESSKTSSPNLKRQNHHYHHRHQPPVTPLAGPSNLDGATCFDFDHFSDNPRSCYPVRPIPRRTAQVRDNENPHHHNHNSSSHCGLPINNQAATVGVVNPTSLGVTNEESQDLRHTTNPFVRYRQPGPTTSSSVAASASASGNNKDFVDIDELRYKYIQYCIKLANKAQHKNKDNMVNENNENDTVVNSTSLEDVAASETTERAQSVTSIHSSIEPSTPTYEDLQSRLEASTRNIQNIKEQQQQLLLLQNQAKEHLAEMESLRNQATPLRQGTGSNGAPDYETIEQVHTDMSSLVGRMKNLTNFIQGQNELSNLLGDDGPELLAEQRSLQQKLEGLKSHRDEMKNLIMELHEVNRVAERRASEQSQQQQVQTDTEQPSGSGTSNQQETPARVVPIEYSRVVPIELVSGKQKHQKRQQQRHQAQENQMNGGTVLTNGVTESSDGDIADCPETAALIQQKMSDIQMMKKQLNRLKSMMETVKLIEDRTEGPSPSDIGYEDASARRSVDIPVERDSTPKNTNSQSRAANTAAPFDKDRTPVQDDFIDDPNDPVITDKIHMLNEVTRDLRAQAMSLASERDRIRALKEEIMRRKAENAAIASSQEAASSNDENKNSNSNHSRASPSKLSNKDNDRDLLEAQYAAKKKEFQQLCQRIQSDEPVPAPTERHTRDEIEEEEEEDNNLNGGDLLNEGQGTPKPDLSYYYPQSQGVSCNSSVHGGPTSKPHAKEPTGPVAGDAEGPSCEAGSIKSGSSRSFSMPPPMRAMSNREAAWRKTSQEQYEHFGAPSTVGSSGPVPPPLPVSWNPYYFHNAPFSPHFIPSLAGGAGNSDCICQANPTGVATPAGSSGVQQDPVMLQQFIQTQQMLINSVCQCNQMLWHQQREIDALNSTIHMLQERLLSFTNGSDMVPNHRSESVPPAGTVQNNLYPSLNRAQSEQPHHFPSLHPHPHHAHHLPTIMSQSSSSSFQRRSTCNIQQQHQQQLSNHGTAFNYSADQQANGNVYSSAMNNLCASMPPMPNYNNVGGNTATGGSNNPGTPIFMHHHNNTQHPVHNNNSNLLNATQQQSQQAAAAAAGQNSQSPNVSSGASNLTGSALNNQVPPGNRANNYWDNFRSYSRQNLLSSNSCKSNEEQNHNQHQHLQQQQSQHLQHQQEPHNLPIFTNSLNVGYRTDSNTNNLNPPNYDNKYLHTFRNRINANSAMHTGGTLMNASPIPSSTSSTQPTNYSNMMNIAINQPDSQQQHGTNSSAWNVIGANGDVFDSNDLTHDIRNMNLNFGNNEPNKVPMKPSSFRRPAASTNRRIRHTQSEPEAFVEQRPRSSQQPEITGDLLNSPDLFSGVMQSLDTVMDDTSDEIKRNLLVNALKSEKFTTKFYESLKEDVFRRIDTFLRAKDGEQQFLSQFYRDHNLASTSDPLRKLYLNEVRSLRRPTDELNETESNNGENEDEDDDEDDEEEGAQALDNHNILNNNNNEAQNALGLNAKDIKLLADKFIGSTAAGTSSQTDRAVQFPDYELINFIIARIHEDTQSNSVVNDALLVDIAKLTATAIQNDAKVKSRKKGSYDTRLLISPKKIYAKLKTKPFPRDRDGFLMWYQSYLEAVLFVTLNRDEDDPRPSRENNNNAHTSNRYPSQNITPLALSWADIQNIYMNAHQVRKSNIPLRATASGSGGSALLSTEVESKIENNSSLRQQQQQCAQSSPRSQPSNPQQQQQHHLAQISIPLLSTSSNIMNEDLAEADQVCSSTNSTMHSSVEVHAGDILLGGIAVELEPLPSPDNAEGQLISIPSESHALPNQSFLNFLLDDTENNENPEEENRHLSADQLAVLHHPIPADSDNAEEDADGQNQRPESSLPGVFGTDPLTFSGGTGKRNSVP